jgi:hypothetical protein
VIFHAFVLSFVFYPPISVKFVLRLNTYTMGEEDRHIDAHVDGLNPSGSSPAESVILTPLCMTGF